MGASPWKKWGNFHHDSVDFSPHGMLNSMPLESNDYCENEGPEVEDLHQEMAICGEHVF